MSVPFAPTPLQGEAPFVLAHAFVSYTRDRMIGACGCEPDIGQAVEVAMLTALHRNRTFDGTFPWHSRGAKRVSEWLWYPLWCVQCSFVRGSGTENTALLPQKTHSRGHMQFPTRLASLQHSLHADLYPLFAHQQQTPPRRLSPRLAVREPPRVPACTLASYAPAFRQ